MSVNLYFNPPSNMYMLGPDPLPPILTDIRQPTSNEVSTISARYYLLAIGVSWNDVTHVKLRRTKV
jgi:hypothetical protein